MCLEVCAWNRSTPCSALSPAWEVSEVALLLTKGLLPVASEDFGVGGGGRGEVGNGEASELGGNSPS